MKLTELLEEFSILRFQPNEPVPAWVLKSSFYAIVKTNEELSVLCESSHVPDLELKKEVGWRCLKVIGPLEFSLTGVLASLTAPLAQAKISIFALSTFDTDYLLVKKDRFSEAKATLAKAGFEIV